MPRDGARPAGPPLLWLNPIALASERWVSPRSLPEVRRALDAMPEQFLTIAGLACLQRNTWYRNPWKTWAMIRCEALARGTQVRVSYAANPATSLVVLAGVAISFATLPLSDAALYVSTLGGVIAIVGSFGRFVAREDVSILRAAIVHAVGASVESASDADELAR